MRKTTFVLLLVCSAVVILTVVIANTRSDGARAAGPGGTITAIDVPNGNAGSYTSMVLDTAGNPVISYFDSVTDDLKVAHCSDPGCTSGTTIVSPDTAGCVGAWTSIALDAGGNPVVSYQQCNFGHVKLLHCGSPDCSAGNIITTPDMTGGSGFDISMRLDASGRPVIAYDDNQASLYVLRCGDANCSSGNTITTPDVGVNVGDGVSLALDSSDRPVVSFYDEQIYYPLNQGSRLHVLACGDPICSSGNTVASPDATAQVLGKTSTQIDASGAPVVSYMDNAGDALKVLDCGDAACSSGNTTSSFSLEFGFSPDTSLTIGADGSIAVAYTVWDVHVLRCDTSACSSGVTIGRPDPTRFGGWPAIVLDNNGLPILAYLATIQTSGELRVAHCGVPDCAGKPTPTPPPTVGPLFPDSDGDHCNNMEEYGSDPEHGGRRDPFNPWDFYDVVTTPGNIGRNGTIDLFGDIFTVAAHYGENTSNPGYDDAMDRSPPPSADQEPDPSRREPWDLGPPDGMISLFADIFGVAFQFGHSCVGEY